MNTTNFTYLLSELKSIIFSATGIASTNATMLTSVQGTKKSFVEEIRDGSLYLPLIVISVGDYVIADESALNSIGVMRAPTCVTVVNQWGGPGNNQDGAYGIAVSIKQAFDPTNNQNFGTFKTIEQGKVMSNVDSPINNSLLQNSKVQIVCSSVDWEPGLLTIL